MNDENVGLSRDHTIMWIINMLACSGTDYESIMERLRKVSTPNLMRIDKVATSTGPDADSLRHELLNEPDMDLIVDACILAPKHDHHHTVSNIKSVLLALDSQGLKRDKVNVHLQARSLYMDSCPKGESNVYTDNLPLVRLVDQHPDRLYELMKFMFERQSNDIQLLQEYLTGAAPLSEGTL